MKPSDSRSSLFEPSPSGWAKKFFGLFHQHTEVHASAQYINPNELIQKIPKQALVLFLDYDGILFPIVRIPELAKPDKPLLILLRRLAEMPDFEIHIVSGRSSETLEHWFQGIDIQLHAEHGALNKKIGEQIWTSELASKSDWQNNVLPLLEDFTKITPGSFVEKKKYSISWHYRMADLELGERMADQLQIQATELCVAHGLEVVPGKRLLEIRHIGANKGRVIADILASQGPKVFPIAIGDDSTDEDMFMALAGKGMTIAVGDLASQAEFRFRFPSETRQFLELLTTRAKKRVH